MATPERQMNASSLRGMARTSFCFPCTKTISQAMTSTTQVRIAVPRLDSTPEIPIFPRMEVRLAKKAEPTAKRSQLPLPPSFRSDTSFFSIIRKIPAAITTTAAALSREIPSPKKISASRIVRTVLDLSMGTTLLISPICSARK